MKSWARSYCFHCHQYVRATSSRCCKGAIKHIYGTWKVTTARAGAAPEVTVSSKLCQDRGEAGSGQKKVEGGQKKGGTGPHG